MLILNAQVELKFSLTFVWVPRDLNVRANYLLPSPTGDETATELRPSIRRVRCGGRRGRARGPTDLRLRDPRGRSHLPAPACAHGGCGHAAGLGRQAWANSRSPDPAQLFAWTACRRPSSGL